MQVVDWLTSIGLGQYSAAFEQNAIAWEDLPGLVPEELSELGVTALGHRKKLVREIERLRVTTSGASPAPDAPAAPRETPPSAERRLATVMFADLSNYTGLSTSLDIEELRQLEQRLMSVLEGVIEDYGGTVTDRHGDSVVAVFGYPIAHENDVLRAAGAALAMHAAMPEFSRELKRDLDLGSDQTMHIGIDFGEIVPASSDPHGTSDYRVVGRSLAMGRRLSDIAGPEQTIISKPVHQLLSGRAQCRPLGHRELQGFALPTDVYDMLAVDLEQPGLTRTNFVDRADESEIVLNLMNACRTDSRLRVITLGGEAGVGKSRFVDEVARAARARGFADSRVAIVDFGSARRRSATETLAMRVHDFRTGASARRQAADDLLESGQIDASLRLFLYRFLGVPLGAADASTFDAMDDGPRREGRRSLLAQLIRIEAAEQPLLLIVEDMHWADANTIDEISALANAIRETPSTLMVVWRGEQSSRLARWLAVTETLDGTSLTLETLPNEYARELASSIGEIDEKRLQAALHHARGNPLFLEQIIRHWSEVETSEIIGADVPHQVRSLVQARIDRLADNDRRALQAASVLGQRFDLEPLRHILQMADYDCGPLEHARFVRRYQHRYEFQHDLVRQGVYSTLLNAERVRLHRAAAEFFSGDDILLKAEHLQKAGDPSASDFFHQAAERSAFDHDYDQALTLVERGLGDAISKGRSFELHHLKGELLSLLGRQEDSNRAYAAALEQAPNRLARCSVLIDTARNLSQIDQAAEADAVLAEAEEIAVAEEDEKFLSDIYRVRGGLEMSIGNVSVSVGHHQKAYETAMRSGSAESISESLRGLGISYYLQGRIIDAKDKFLECIDFSTSMGLERIAIELRHWIGYYYYFSMDTEKAMSIGRQACSDGERICHARTIMNGGRLIGYLLFAQGRWQEAERQLSENLQLTQELQAHRFVPIIRAHLAKLRAISGRQQEAEGMAEQAYKLSSRLGEKYFGPAVLGCYATFVRDPARQDWALAEGNRILQQECGSHNYFWFYRDAISVSLERGDWAGARRYAGLLAAYTAAQPLPWSDYHIAKARTLAAIGQGSDDPALLDDIARLTRQASTAGLRPELEGLRLARVKLTGT